MGSVYVRSALVAIEVALTVVLLVAAGLLGATRRQVVAMVVRQGIAITLGGSALGLVAATASTQVMTALLYEVTATDLATFAAAVAIVVGTSFAACCGPAVKASLIDPLVALRCE